MLAMLKYKPEPPPRATGKPPEPTAVAEILPRCVEPGAASDNVCPVTEVDLSEGGACWGVMGIQAGTAGRL
jgi:hypothetical protein